MEKRELKNIAEYIGKKYAIHCKTHQQWMDIVKLLNYNLRDRDWVVYGEESCIDNYGSYCAYGYYKQNNYEILLASDFLPSEYLSLVGRYMVLKEDYITMWGDDGTYYTGKVASKGEKLKIIERCDTYRDSYKVQKFGWNYITEDTDTDFWYLE